MTLDLPFPREEVERAALASVRRSIYLLFGHLLTTEESDVDTEDMFVSGELGLPSPVNRPTAKKTSIKPSVEPLSRVVFDAIVARLQRAASFGEEGVRRAAVVSLGELVKDSRCPDAKRRLAMLEFLVELKRQVSELSPYGWKTALTVLLLLDTDLSSGNCKLVVACRCCSHGCRTSVGSQRIGWITKDSFFLFPSSSFKTMAIVVSPFSVPILVLRVTSHDLLMLQPCRCLQQFSVIQYKVAKELVFLHKQTEAANREKHHVDYTILHHRLAGIDAPTKLRREAQKTLLEETEPSVAFPKSR